MEIKRIQGKEWITIKNRLKLIKYITNKNGYIKGFYRSDDGKIYTHWLNDFEIKSLREGV